MNRAEALEKAEEIVAKRFPATTSRGYPDNALNVATWTAAVLEIASFLAGPEPIFPAPSSAPFSVNGRE